MTINAWVTTKENTTENATYFRAEFNAQKDKNYTLKITALGWFKVFVNGKVISTDEFAPGWSDYTKSVPLLTYDITSFLVENNCIGVLIGNGWAGGSVQFGEMKKYYGVNRPLLFAKLISGSADGQYEQELKWTYSYGAIRDNDIMFGEVYDQNFSCEGFSVYGYKKNQTPCEVENRKLYAIDNFNLKASVHEILNDYEIVRCNDNYLLVDFKQNFTGVARLTVKALTDCKITVRHGEILDDNGNLYTENLRTAKATDTYILKEGEHLLRPHLTYHGFRYIDVIWEGEVEFKNFEGLAIYTNSPIVGSVKTSSSLVNRIFSNSTWGVKSNYLINVPTDCPQRDERLGWLADAGIYAKTAMYLMDCGDLYDNYLSLIEEAADEEGGFPCIAPNAKGFLANCIGSAGWSDAYITIIADHYDTYGDKNFIERHLPAALKFMEWIENHSENYKRNAFCFSDWLSIGCNQEGGGGDVDPQVFDLCFYALDLKIVIKLLKVLNRNYSEYEGKYESVKRYFLDNLYDGKYVFGRGTQTALMMAQRAELLTLDQIKAPLIEDVEKHGLTCGFVGIKYLLPTLCDLGREDLAYKLITSTEYPSWGYSVVNGATTIWERWDSYTKENGINKFGMNSFNHFSFGSCMEWAYTHMLGIKPLSAGFDGVEISPVIDTTGEITWAEGSYKMPNTNTVYVKWNYVGKKDRKHCATVIVTQPKDIQTNYNFRDWEIISKTQNNQTIVFELSKKI